MNARVGLLAWILLIALTATAAAGCPTAVIKVSKAGKNLGYVKVSK